MKKNGCPRGQWKKNGECTPIPQDIHKLRKQVMNHLYRARELTQIHSGKKMPWIKVRIKPLPENKKGKTLARVDSIGISDNNEMDISERMTEWTNLELKSTVFHELGHKYLDAPHVKDSKNLMYPYRNRRIITNKKIEEDFIELAKKKKRMK